VVAERDFQEMVLTDKRNAIPYFLLLLAGFAGLSGCKVSGNPWEISDQSRPVSERNLPQSIYAPMPTILPSVHGAAIETDQSLEAELDLLSELHVEIE
jgi:hypothetical protein